MSKHQRARQDQRKAQAMMAHFSERLFKLTGKQMQPSDVWGLVEKGEDVETLKAALGLAMSLSAKLSAEKQI